VHEVQPKTIVQRKAVFVNRQQKKERGGRRKPDIYEENPGACISERREGSLGKKEKVPSVEGKKKKRTGEGLRMLQNGGLKKR